MVTSISVEEFQRFQTQLLDLRESQILANDARLRAEKRIKQLEEELNSTQLALTHAQTDSLNHQNSLLLLEELKQENQLLRDKLLNTEASFQLQSSTLRAECYRLTKELDNVSQHLSEIDQNANNSHYDQRDHAKVIQCSKYCQTTPIDLQHKSIQIDYPIDDDTDVDIDQLPTFLLDNIENLANSLKQADSTHVRLEQIIEQLNNKVDMLERKLSCNLSNYQQLVQKLTKENEYLSMELNKSQEKCHQFGDVESALRNQIDVIKRRSEKLNHELRRELNRFIVRGGASGGGGLNGADIDYVSSHLLRKNSQHSSSSSLYSSSGGTAASITAATATTTNGNNSTSGCSTLTSDQQQEVYNDNDNSDVPIMHNKKLFNGSTLKNDSFHEMPPGFFSTADFKAIIDRMSEVQEENCILRRCKKRLEADLLAKSKVIQKRLDNYLQSPEKQSTTYHGNNVDSTITTTTTTTTTSVPTPTVTFNPYRSHTPHTPTTTNHPTSASSSSFPNTTAWFPFLRNLTAQSDSSTPPTSTSLSSINVQTVNRLKFMCEQLMTENIELKEKLQQHQQQQQSCT
ncbi:unnamed protein product [Schistosoma turkestanicum]|nr:unnamed protein product [Schistosoma turkestanicum]